MLDDAGRGPREGPATPSAGPAYRRTFVVTGAVLGVAGAAGAIQLMAGASTPPVSDLDALGLHSWVLPAIWLFVSVAVPWTVVTALALGRRRVTPTAVLVACALLLFELVVQIPFIGPSPLQVLLGAVAVVIGVLALQARRDGWTATG